MADSDVIRKLRIYRALYRLNRGFAQVTRNLDNLLVEQFFKDDQPDEGHPQSWQEQLGEVQAMINRRVTENLHNLEHGDMKRLSRIVAMAPQVRKLYFGEDFEEETPARRKRR